MKYTLDHIAGIIGADPVARQSVIEHLLPDSRKVFAPAQTLFFALKGPRRNGHQFIGELYKKGVRSFVVSEFIDTSSYPEADFLLVKNTLAALQQLITHHRQQFNIPVIGITGSNGKTIVKEWLYQLLHEDYNVVRSPKSFNSQIGVPLSVWQMSEQHSLGIFEAGISTVGEMEKLETIVRPTIGILTNIGEAHNEGFDSNEQKLSEKLKLFVHCAVVIGRENYLTDQKKHIESFKGNPRLVTWGSSADNDLVIKSIDKKEKGTIITAVFANEENQITIPFKDDASVENAITCYLVSLHLGLDNATIKARMKKLQPVNMRLEVKKGVNHCTIINDSYSADISSLQIALNFLSQQGTQFKRTAILSDFVQTGMDDKKLYDHVLSELKRYSVSKLIGIGEKITKELNELSPEAAGAMTIELYPSTAEFMTHYRSSQFKDEIILVKGARIFEFEQIVHLLEQKVHQTVLEINLNAISHNLKQYQRLLEPATKMMAMVKAFAYGSGGTEIASVLQYHKVDYLGVAYADEGVELRKAGITLPIMVLNAEHSTFDALVEYNLEPDIYSLELLQTFDTYLKKEGIQHYPVHIEIETGMNRLGFDIAEMEILSSYLCGTTSFMVQSVFSHLSSGEDPKDDEFTLLQGQRFITASQQLQKNLGYSFLKHIANSAAIIRHPSLQMDMVRLGIGMYGVDTASSQQLDLQPVATLKSTIAQLKYLEAGESVGYNRKGVVKQDSIIATVRIGYADGFSRKLGNNTGKMLIKSKLAPVIGTVCMDMTMIDVTGIPGVKEGDDVIIFGEELPIQQLADWAGTIPYEIMTGISQRVKRVYFEE
ncbi:MAG: bifunctional UDP-N-acetylmuramoyl-tripeptide:D-alanyl-D-alanine ligase/alanine racemase [Chitinophagaceae bacterium]